MYSLILLLLTVIMCCYNNGVIFVNIFPSSAEAVITTEMRQALLFAALQGQITAHAYCFISVFTAILYQQGNYAQ